MLQKHRKEAAKYSSPLTEEDLLHITVIKQRFPSRAITQGTSIWARAMLAQLADSEQLADTDMYLPSIWECEFVYVGLFLPF